jgi:hypothetical protein
MGAASVAEAAAEVPMKALLFKVMSISSLLDFFYSQGLATYPMA